MREEGKRGGALGRASRGARLAGAVVTALVLGAGSATAAQPVPGEFVPAERSSRAADPSLLAGAVSRYADQYGVDKAQAERILRAQGRGGGLEEELRRELGDGFGELRFVQERATWQVRLSPSGDAAAATAVLARRGIDGPLIDRVRWSAKAREAAQRALYERLAPAVDAGEIRLLSDPDKGVVVATSAATRAGVALTAKRAIAVAGLDAIATVVTAERSPRPSAAACDDSYCDAPLVAGVQYNPSGCTIAFSAHAGGGSYNLTVGHCISNPNWPNPGRAAWTCSAGSAWCGYFGHDLGGYYSPAGDGGVVAVTSTTFPNYAGFRVFGWAFPTYSVKGTQNASIGMYLCATGRITRTTCGTVYSLSEQNAQGGSAMIGLQGACAIPGDSGGPLFDPANGNAVGMTAATYNRDACPPGGTRTTYEPVTRAASTLGVTVKTA